ncbi:hypothetical protein BD770DRAFT_441409 [Pilaira anomala]|nr:hypothetical protein BD770DRAFT_441409 [Pilaira anomala]
MRHALISDELDEIIQSYDYGIVPGSATVFVRDVINNIGRLDLILLEGVMIVVEVSNEGYKVASCSPLSNDAMDCTKSIQKILEVSFDTMENLLMAVSPLFCQKFQQALYNKLESVHNTNNTTTIPTTQQQVFELNQQVLNDLHDWMH